MDDKSGLRRELGLLGLVATGACSMVGAGVNVVPVMVQRSVPGIGPWSRGSRHTGSVETTRVPILLLCGAHGGLVLLWFV